MGEFLLGLRIAVVPLVSVVIGLLMYQGVSQVHDLFLDSTGGLGGDAAFWSLFYLCILLGWIVPVYISARWILSNYNVLANTTHEDALIPVKDWVCKVLPGVLATACLVGVLIGQFQAVLTTPELFSGKDEALESIKQKLPGFDPSKGPLLLDIFKVSQNAKSAGELRELAIDLITFYGDVDLITVIGYLLLAIPFAMWWMPRLIRALPARGLRVFAWILMACAGVLSLFAYIIVSNLAIEGWDQLRERITDELFPIHLGVLPALTIILIWATWAITRFIAERDDAARPTAPVDTVFAAVAVVATGGIGMFLLVDPLLITRYLNRAPLLATMLGVWVPVLTFISLYSNRVRIPLVIVGFVALGLANWLLGDAYNLRLVDNARIESPDLTQSLERWAAANNCVLPPPRSGAQKEQSTQGATTGATPPAPASAAPTAPPAGTGQKPPCPAPLIILAAGGASRASFFVTSVLGKLMDDNQDRKFTNRIFAVSSVSGGSLGAAVFQAALADSLMSASGSKGAPVSSELDPPCRSAADRGGERVLVAGDDPQKGWKSCMQLLLGGDFLSPAMVSLMFSDMLNLRRYGDRAATLERAWEERYKAITGRDTLTIPMDQLRKRVLEADQRNWLPLLLINGTSVTTGRRIIATDLQFVASPSGQSCRKAARQKPAADCYRLFKDAYDLDELLEDTTAGRGSPHPAHACRNCDIRLSTAASISARFPVISPHGTIRNAKGYVADRLVDGGYFENNGALTATDLAEALRERYPELRPIIIQITNEPQSRFSVCAWDQAGLPRPSPESSIAFAVLSSPLGALLKTTTARGSLASTHLCRFISSDRQTLFPHFTVNPQRGLLGEKHVSMSWWLSRNVQIYLDRQLHVLPDPQYDERFAKSDVGDEKARDRDRDNGALLHWFRQDYFGRDPSAKENRPELAGAVSKSTNFEDIAQEYLANFDAARFRDDWVKQINWAAERLLKSRELYEAIERATGVPWHFVGIIHHMEASFSFKTPLSSRPTAGAAAFNWEESAIEAMRQSGLADQTDWSLARTLYTLEHFNGFGYRKKFGFKTPYLWSGSTQFTSGKYVADGVFDPNATSKQLGAAVLLKWLIERGHVTVQR